jgi:hypothetical protein
MKDKAIRVQWLGPIVMSMALLATANSNPLETSRDAQHGAENHAAGFTAKITMVDGTTRQMDIQGVGCSAALCSRVFILAKTHGGSRTTIWFDRIATINHLSEDTALFLMKDGTEQHVTLIPDFRVLYVSARNGRTEKLDLRTIKSLQILPSAN